MSEGVCVWVSGGERVLSTLYPRGIIINMCQWVHAGVGVRILTHIMNVQTCMHVCMFNGMGISIGEYVCVEVCEVGLVSRYLHCGVKLCLAAKRMIHRMLQNPKSTLAPFKTHSSHKRLHMCVFIWLKLPSRQERPIPIELKLIIYIWFVFESKARKRKNGLDKKCNLMILSINPWSAKLTTYVYIFLSYLRTLRIPFDK